jgi:hypothetical protein
MLLNFAQNSLFIRENTDSAEVMVQRSNLEPHE